MLAPDQPSGGHRKGCLYPTVRYWVLCVVLAALFGTWAWLLTGPLFIPSHAVLYATPTIVGITALVTTAATLTWLAVAALTDWARRDPDTRFLTDGPDTCPAEVES